eukprot:m.151649 g.151649  ORF g.151649 m.151649 type:complete len:56 (-) comp16200_c11_seq5:1424-1591(-)
MWSFYNSILVDLSTFEACASSCWGAIPSLHYTALNLLSISMYLTCTPTPLLQLKG